MLANHGFLSLRQLCLGYLGKLVVEELSLSINKGEMLGLLGPNGSGKTTTIHAITGNLQVTSGSIFLDGVSIEEHPETFKKMIGFVPQELGPHLSCAARVGAVIDDDFVDHFRLGILNEFLVAEFFINRYQKSLQVGQVFFQLRSL